MKKQTNRCMDAHLDRKDRAMCFCMKEENHKGKHRYGVIMRKKDKYGPEVTKYYQWATNKNDKITQLTLEGIKFYTSIESKYDKKTIDFVFNHKRPPQDKPRLKTFTLRNVK